MAQARLVQSLLAQAHGVAATDQDHVFPIKTYITTGDQVMAPTLADSGGKGLFTKEVEEALLNGDADIAVHSMKDMPAQMPKGLCLAAVPARENPADALVTMSGISLEDLPAGARMGTSSVRRGAQVRRLRPDLIVVPMRGNVQTRLKKLEQGDADATFLAEAGLARLARTDVARVVMGIDQMLPAIGQGTLCVQRRTDDTAADALCAPINCARTALANQAERGLIEALDGSCRTPIAGHATLEGDRLLLRGEILMPDGQHGEQATTDLAVKDGDDPYKAAYDQGAQLAQRLCTKAGPEWAQLIRR